MIASVGCRHDLKANKILGAFYPGMADDALESTDSRLYGECLPCVERLPKFQPKPASRYVPDQAGLILQAPGWILPIDLDREICWTPIVNPLFLQGGGVAPIPRLSRDFFHLTIFSSSGGSCGEAVPYTSAMHAQWVMKFRYSETAANVTHLL